MQQFIESLKTSPLRDAHVEHHEILSSRSAAHGKLSPPLAAPLREALAKSDISKLYKHQVDALSLFRGGENVVIATPTASGKSLIYNIALLELLAKEPTGYGLYLFPLKALAQDQYQAFVSLNEKLPPELRLEAAIYDGDTSPTRRRRIKENLPHLIISNPDMLHLGLLPFHQQWESFFRGLSLVVLDEVHTYRGVFGSHVAQVLRRLRRVCSLYGSEPRFILLSATIANAKDFACRLTGLPFQAVEHNGAPQAGRHFFFINPETSSATVAARLFIQALKAGLKTIAFTQARKLTEILHMNVAQAAPDLASRVSSYRAGFLAEERREIERGLASGAVAGVISTSALEMGIDIGGLDVCILVGYPGTIINTWQRSGRVGRGGRDSIVILVAQPDALDQYFMRHPGDFFQRSFEAAVVDPDNSEVVDAHLPCAAAEIPLSLADDLYGQEGLLAARAPTLEISGNLLRSVDGETWYAARRQPQRLVDIRSVGIGYAILEHDGDKVLGKNDGVRVFKECHPGAIYLHRGQQHLVTRLDLKRQNVFVKPVKVRYYTRALSEKETEILAVERSRPVANFVVRLGRLRVTEQVVGYEKRNLYSGELLDNLPLDLPEQSFETVGLWLEIEDALQGMVRRQRFHFMGGIHALEHGLISMFPLFAMCDRNDVGGISIPRHLQLQKSAIFIYDGYPGGVGLAVRGYEMIEELLEKTGEVIASCPCDAGCPSCIHSPKCGSGNKPLDKSAALFLVRALLAKIPVEFDGLDQKQKVLVAENRVTGESGNSEPAVAYLDLETQRLADEVGGWGNVHLMRLALAIIYDQRAGQFDVFTEDEVQDLITRLQEFDLVVGFNLKRFDYRVLGAYTGLDFKKVPTFDLLEDVHQRLGFRLSLAHLAEQTLGKSKSGDGIQAVSWYRQGNLEALISYCKDDVTITKELFQFGLHHGYLVYLTKQGQAVRLPVDWNLDGILRATGRG
ncbi:MAG: DEAD/DEAH box helicase [Deltaproteobacteria bacterium]|nr:MAG: DEAD/DEAH box helicase [Deltaproteobacteria bacterium]